MNGQNVGIEEKDEKADTTPLSRKIREIAKDKKNRVVS